jgi:hypothetical protein
MMGFPLFWLLEGLFMRKIRMCVDVEKTFAEGFEEYILDCKSRNLREGTIRHYRESIKQIYKGVPADTLMRFFVRVVSSCAGQERSFLWLFQQNKRASFVKDSERNFGSIAKNSKMCYLERKNFK